MKNINQKIKNNQNLYPNLLSNTSLNKSNKKNKRRSSKNLFAVHNFNIKINLKIPTNNKYKNSLPPLPYTTILNYFNYL